MLPTDTPKLKRIERLILKAVTPSPLTEAQIAAAVEVQSRWYLRDALRTLRMIHLLTATEAGGETYYSAVTDSVAL